MAIMDKDSGIVLVDIDTETFYCGLNTFDKSLRKAKIYHSKKWIDEVIKQYPHKNFETRNIEISIK